MRSFRSPSLIAVAALLAGCTGTTGSTVVAPDGASSGSGGATVSAGTGGATTSGGTGGATGVPASGGAPGSGGAPASSGGNGAIASGGATSSGGATGAGGRAATASGGATPTGGATSTSTGGARATGGAGGTTTTSTGGAAGATTSAGAPFKGVANSACNDLPTLTASWYYNWTTSPGSCKFPEFVPMVAGKSEKTAAAVTSAINGIAKAGYKTVLGFNEPNKSNQSNLAVADVVAMWPALTANADLRVGSPATSADGQSWFNDFWTQVQAQGLRVDFIALHWYGWNAGSCDAKAASLESYIKWAEGLPGNKPLWLTEWGCLNLSNPDQATVEAFYKGAVAVFAKHPRIERYGWYPWTTNNELVDSSDALTSLGTTFAGEPSTH